MPGIHHLKLFGVPQLLDPRGHPVGLRTRKHLGLLVYLALEARDHPVRRDTLVGLFWRDVHLVRASHSLSQALTAIRDRLGRDALPRSKDSVRLYGGLATDLDSPSDREIDPTDYARPLDGLEGAGGPEFAHWVDRTREACRRQLRTQLMADLTAARTVGLLPAVNRAAALLYAIDPLSDTAALALAEQYLLEGDSAGAIRLLRDHNARSENELGRDPPRQITLLLQRLECGCLPMRVPAGEPDGAGRPSLVKAEVFVGRERELARLEAAWTSACRGNLTKCLISGADGIGKSALVRRFVTSVTARGWPAYLIACQEIGRSIPFATVSDLVRQLMRDPALSGTDPLWLAEASRVTPGLRTMYKGIPEPDATPAEAVRLRVAEALSNMVATVAEGGPLLLVLDRLQNVDPASRDVLHVLSVHLEDTPTLLLATIRSGETEFILTGPGTAGGVEWPTSVELEPLDAEQVQQLIAHLEPRAGEMREMVTARIVELAQGNPYLAEMLLSDWRNNGSCSLIVREMGGNTENASWRPPPTMRLAFERQYEGISPHAQRLIHLLAVAGRCVAVSELESLLGISQPLLDRAALELIDRAIIRTVGGALGFKSDLHRAVVYWAMSGESRSYHHASLARSLTAAAMEDDFQRALEASHHYLKAGMPREAAEKVCMGAELAVLRGAPQEAEKALKAVIATGDPELTTPETKVLLSSALSVQQRYRDSLQALECADLQKCNKHYRAKAANLRAEALHRGRLAEPPTIARVAQQAVIAALDVGDDRLKLEALQVMAEVAYEDGDWDGLRGAERTIEDIGKDASDVEVRALACLALGYCRLVAGDFEGASEKIAYSCRILASLKHHTRLHRALNGLGMCYTDLGLFRRAQATLSQAISVARECGDYVSQANLCGNLGSLYYELGMFSESADCYREAASLDKDGFNQRVSAGISCNAANLAIALGDFAEAELLLDRAIFAAERSRLWPHKVNAILTWADLALARREPETAWTHVEEALSLARAHERPVPDAGQFWRLRMHYEWATGVRGQPSARTDLCRPPIVPRLTHRLEVSAFEEWIAASDQRQSRPGRTAIDQLVELRLFGIVARLAAVHILTDPLPEPVDGESAASLVARAFRNHISRELPSSVGIAVDLA